MKKLIALAVIACCIPLYLFAQPCLTEGIIFTPQEEIDSFQINYPGCTEIEGSLTNYVLKQIPYVRDKA